MKQLNGIQKKRVDRARKREGVLERRIIDRRRSEGPSRYNLKTFKRKLKKLTFL